MFLLIIHKKLQDCSIMAQILSVSGTNTQFFSDDHRSTPLATSASLPARAGALRGLSEAKTAKVSHYLTDHDI